MKDFNTFVRAMFFHRRKFLRSELIGMYKNQLGKPEVDEILEEMQLDPKVRAEQLTVEQIIALHKVATAKVTKA